MKFGRKPAVHTARTMRLGLFMNAALNNLGAPPSVSNDYVAAVDAVTGGDWGMDGNDTVGDCTLADCAHQVMLHTANTGSIVIPTAQDCLSAYSAWAGYVPSDPSTDQGADETSICKHMMDDGMCGVRTSATAMISPSHMDFIRWAVQLFGACRLGIVVGQDSVQQAIAKQPWTQFTANAEGGHDVPVVKYDAQYAYCVTWGALQPISWQLMANPDFLQEVHVELFPAWVNQATGLAPSGFDMAALMEDLQAIEALT